MIEVLDKGKAAAVSSLVETIDTSTGKVIFENQSTVFIRGSGGFGGKKNGAGELLGCLDFNLVNVCVCVCSCGTTLDRGPATALNSPPKRQPDAVVEEKTLPIQAALYRLSGDPNPLHVRFCCQNKIDLKKCFVRVLSSIFHLRIFASSHLLSLHLLSLHLILIFSPLSPRFYPSSPQ